MALAYAQIAPIDSARGEILAQRAVEQSKALSDQLINAFGCDQEQGLVRAAMNVRMGPGIADDSRGSNHCFGDHAFRDATRGETDLNNMALNYMLLRNFIQCRHGLSSSVGFRAGTGVAGFNGGFRL